MLADDERALERAGGLARDPAEATFWIVVEVTDLSEHEPSPAVRQPPHEGHGSQETDGRAVVLVANDDRAAR